MALFTLNEVKQAAASASGSILLEGIIGDAALSARIDRYLISEAAVADRAAIRHFDIFLSHAYVDKIIVTGIYNILQNSGFTVYVDWIHDRQRLNRGTVTSGNAAILRERMHQCSALLYTTTNNHTASKWMPWECGYFDGFNSKTVNNQIQFGHVAILPVTDSPNSSFTGQEYLGLCPIAAKGIHVRRNLNIHNQQTQTRYLHFDQWVSNGHP